jgi:hypothetical protein
LRQPDVEERISQLFAGLGIQRAHVAAGYAAHAVALVSACRELVSSLSLVCPSRFDAEALQSLGSRLLYIHGDRGGNTTIVSQPTATLTEARIVTLPDCADTLWSDALADRPDETWAALLAFLDEMSHDSSVVPVGLPEQSGEHAGIHFRVQVAGRQSCSCR